tara:strand:+ start:120 stop:305 length:186 start_codon:yes stop_codon:yes gene_type:complete
MKIYTLTIGIDEENEEVEFIREEQYKVDDVPRVDIKPEQKSDFDSLIKNFLKSKFNIIGKA